MADYEALKDPLPRWDPKSQELAYNNFTDRYRMELPAKGDPASSGCISIITPSGTDSIPVYLTSPIPVAVAVDIETDSIKVFSASGSYALDVHLVDGSVSTDTMNPVDMTLVQKRFTYNAAYDVVTIKEALITTPSGSPCKLSTFSYNSDGDVDYIVESLGTW